MVVCTKMSVSSSAKLEACKWFDGGAGCVLSRSPLAPLVG